MNAAPALREQLSRLVQEGNSRIVVDLAAVDAVDSSALGALISGLKAARQAGGDLRLAAPGRQVRAVLELTNLSRVLAVAESVDGAFEESGRAESGRAESGGAESGGDEPG
ncbi:MAG: STAS domain-containing protein [Mycobacterium sp.]|nr:STAS domain-containing protein [Mycobacterium sp.]